MEHPGRGPLGSTSTCREDSDEAIIPFGVPSCCPFYRKPTLLYVMARGTVRVLSCTRYSAARQGLLCAFEAPYEHTSRIYLQGAKRHLSSTAPLANPEPMSQSQCLGRCSARMRGRSYPWIFFQWARVPHAAQNRIESSESVQHSGETPQEQGTQTRVAWRTQSWAGLLMLMAIRISGTRCLTLVCPKAD
ncbi:hypothetical protein CFAM422_010274 [Trichoderma lentiforme]|uniref:Uncharacterized protein n=1 Tax=Trichoderma lentiforme TaxID=1567552 RepID=A0A9P4X7S1_9HYPO|nr:hypothetical protein CFAM422_010274 [Trichoderma lentiforme]